MSKLDPTFADVNELLDDMNPGRVPADLSVAALLSIWRALAPYIARKRRDATVAFLRQMAAGIEDEAINGTPYSSIRLRRAADAIERDEDLGDGT